MEPVKPPLSDIKKLLEGDLKDTGTDVKGIKIDLIGFDDRLQRIEGKLGKLEAVVERFQTEVGGAKQKAMDVENKAEKLEISVNGLQEERRIWERL